MNAEWLAAHPHLLHVFERMQSVLELVDDAHEKWRQSTDSIDYAAFEDQANRAVADIECAVHQVTLSAIDVDAAVIKIRTKTYRRVMRSEVEFNTMAGSARLERTLYREMGKPNSRVINVVSKRIGAVEGTWLPRTAQAMAHLLAQVTSRESAITAKELNRLPYSRSSFEHVGHAVGMEYVCRREGIEKQLIEAYELPQKAVSISVSIDRVAVPVEEKIADADKDQKKRVKKLKAEIAEVPARFTTSEREQAA
ncbi:MAG: hypothetical protein GY822_04590, partial [Deltaproteobacteria bacterium]|nr:hypothetical protein [Deltaproteobacteria bacterium]